jgi:hypothetical protein
VVMWVQLHVALLVDVISFITDFLIPWDEKG